MGLIGKHDLTIRKLAKLDTILTNLDNLVSDINQTNSENGPEYDAFDSINLSRFLDECPKVIEIKCNAIIDRIDVIKKTLFEVKPSENANVLPNITVEG